MSLTPAQVTALKAAIQGDANIAGLLVARQDGQIAAYYNAGGAGSIWRPAIGVSELNTAVVWSEFILLSQGARDAYFAMTQGGTVDATNSNIRTGFNSIFTGSVSLTNLTALAQRVPTRFEALFTTAQVCSCFGQVISPADVVQALGS
jgi:hypothetical protein